MSVTGGGIRWPNAAALASGHAYHSTLQIQVGSGQTENAGVNVYGAGTETVIVPAGTYQASVVVTTIAAKGETIVVTTWIAQGVGTVKTQIQINGAGAAGLTHPGTAVLHQGQERDRGRQLKEGPPNGLGARA